MGFAPRVSRFPILLLSLAPALLVSADVMVEPVAPYGAVRATAIPLDLDDPRRVRVGALVYVGGWALRGDDPWIGGISSMAIDGDRFTLLGDEGTLIRFRMGADAIPRDAVARRVPGPGRLPDRRDRDMESLARDPVTGRFWVGMEQRNAILRYDAGFTHVERSARPPAMRHWPANGGIESLARLRDGRFLAISETQPGRMPGTRAALLFASDPTEPGPPPLAFDYRPPQGFDPTDAVELPDGRIAVLNRRLTLRDGVAAAIVGFPRAAMRAGAVVAPAELARLQRPLVVDNMEALAITRERGATMLWIASDDNLSPLQRSLLLKFRLAG